MDATRAWRFHSGAGLIPVTSRWSTPRTARCSSSAQIAAGAASDPNLSRCSDWSGREKSPSRWREMRAKSDGFELRFTQPVDPQTASAPESYNLETYTYIYHADYGSPEVDQTVPTVQSVTVSPDHLSVRLFIAGVGGRSRPRDSSARGALGGGQAPLARRGVLHSQRVAATGVGVTGEGVGAGGLVPACGQTAVRLGVMSASTSPAAQWMPPSRIF